MHDSPEHVAERRDGLLVSSIPRRPDKVGRHIEPVEQRVDTVNRRQFRTRLETHRWRSVRRRVAAVIGTPRTWRQGVRAAILAAGPGAFVSHVTALVLYGVYIAGQASDVIHLSAPRARKIRMTGVLAHRFQNVQPGDVVDRDGIPVASPVRIVIDMSGTLTDAQLGTLVDELIRRKLLKIGDLHARLSGLRPAPGRSVARLRRIASDRPVGYQSGDSELEGRIIRLLAKHNFPAPQGQFWVRRTGWQARIDHAYPEVLLYLESDSFGWHQYASDLDNDSRRRNRLVIEGWHPLSFTWRMTDDEIVATMAAVYDRVTNTWKIGGPAPSTASG
jgi:hypothetical protein